MKSNHLLKALAFIFFLSGSFRTMASQYELTNKLNSSAFTVGASFKVKDPQILAPTVVPASLFTYYSKVSLVYGRESRSDLDYSNSTWTSTITFTITYYDKLEHQLDQVTNNVLTISNGNAPVFIASQTFAKNYGYAIVTITNVSTGTIPSDIRLELSLVCTREDNILAAPVLGRDNTSGTLYWSYLNGAESYDLEWVYLDKNDPATATVAALTDPFQLQEPVRINTSNQYFIPNHTYPEGTVYYRVRGVGKYVGLGSLTQAYSAWSYGGNGVTQVKLDISTTVPNVFEKNKDWNYVVTYSEGGKYKKVMNFYDGSYRQRQALTNVSTDGSKIAAESKYDFEGRKTVDILPVPLAGSDLKYITNLNTFTTNNKQAYDNNTGGSLALSNLSGASQYYSVNNNIGGINSAYIPDAEGYPFNQTEYTRDNTGRITRQSNFGAMLRLQNPTTSTKYTRNFYGNTNATELQRMFGSNVGESKHYKKYLTVDANGQASVSYHDQEDRVIATALVGSSPANLSSLSSNTPSTYVVSLNRNNVVDPGNSISKSVSTILNTLPNTVYTFNYDLTGVINKADNTYCKSCTYDLVISFFAPDGTELTASRVTQTGITAGAIASCSTTTDNFPYAMAPKQVTFTDIGEYTVIKELKLSSGAMDILMQDVSTRSDFPNLNTLITTQLGLINQGTCDITCEDRALTANPTWSLPLNQTDVDAWVKTNCGPNILQAITDADNDECKSMLIQMELQVSPGGFYYENANQTIFNAAYNLSSSWTDANGNAITKPSLAQVKDPDQFIDDWALNLVKGHPEYCHYTFCINDMNSTYFDRTMALKTDWTDAQAAPNYTNPLAIDPYFTGGAHGTAYSNVLTQMNQAFDETKLTISAAYPSKDIDGNGTIGYVTLNNFVNTYVPYVNPSTPNPSYIPNSQEKWRYFRGRYNGFKLAEQVAYIKAAGCPYLTGDDAIVNDPTLPATEAGVNSTNDANMTAHCSGMCNENANVWINMLQGQCNVIFTPADISTMTTRFLNYCMGSCGYLNEKGYLVTSDISVNSDLIAVQNLLNTNYPACSLSLASISVASDCKTSSTISQLIVHPQVNAHIALINDFLDYAVTHSNSTATTNGVMALGNFPLTQLNAYNQNWQYYNASQTPSGNDYCYISAASGLFLSHCGGQGIGLDAGYFFSNSTYTIQNWRRITNIRAQSGTGVPPHPYFEIEMEMMDGVRVYLQPVTLDEYTDFRNGTSGYALTTKTQTICTEYQDPTCTPMKMLTVSSYCPTSTTKRKWRITNPNNYSVNVNWSITGTIQKSIIAVDANGDTYFETDGDNTTSYTAVITVNGVQQSTATSGYTPCSNVIVTAVPTLTPATVRQWRFTNPTNSDVSIAWSTTSPTQSGTIIAVKNRDTYLTTTATSTGTYNLSVPSISGSTIPNTGQTLTYTNDPVNKNCAFTFNLSWSDKKQECIRSLKAQAVTIATTQYNQAVATYLSTYLNDHVNKCLSAPLAENFNYSCGANEYHYTLYYYDQAGNLVQTVPPNGADILPSTAFDSKGNYYPVGHASHVEPVHRLKTNYKYNSVNQVIYQVTPDAGESYTWYNDKGQVRLTQNAKQSVASTGTYRYSFIQHDPLGRVIKTGQLEQYPQSFADFNNINTARPLLNNAAFPDEVTYTLTQITQTFYDNTYGTALAQENLRGRVSASIVRPTTATTGVQTFYSYDIHGNVKSLVQSIPVLGDKRTDYEYDLISSNVKKVYFQKGLADQFIHCYEYNADNKLLSVKTTENEQNWEEQARYLYYPHGPLARVELGQDKVQGLDYYYTLQGWLKGVNTPGIVNGIKDPGTDAVQGTVNQNHCKDEYAYNLGYFNGDYKPISGTVSLGAGASDYWTGLAGTNLTPVNSTRPLELGLFNGNVSLMVTDLPEFDRYYPGKTVMGRVFKYDQLNRLTKALGSLSASTTTTNSGWTAAVANANFYEDFAYDANGNILSANRNTETGTVDQLSYNYDWIDPTVPLAQRQLRVTNRLYEVDDNVAPSAFLDIDDQGTFNNTPSTINTSNNYAYDEIGNLIKDVAEGINNIDWTVSGKILKITYTSGKTIDFTYDASGHRVSKNVQLNQTNKSTWTTEFYVRDAGGNVMANYTLGHCGNVDPVFIDVDEFSIYGSSRLGVKSSKRHLVACSTSTAYPMDQYVRAMNTIIYELSDHLGNVLATVNDIKTGVTTTLPGTPSAISSFEGNDQNLFLSNYASLMDNTIKNSGNSSIKLISTVGGGFGPAFNLIKVNPGDWISAEVMALRQVSAQTGMLWVSLTDASGNTLTLTSNGAPQDYAAFITTTGVWENVVWNNWRVPFGLSSPEVYLKVYTKASGGTNPVWFDDMKVTIVSTLTYKAKLASVQNYYSFGMQMPNRGLVYSVYKYGFNGQEMDNEISGTGNSYTAEYWQYESRLGRRWNIDPVPQIAISDYAVNRNNPIYYKDPDGDCPLCVTAALGAGIGVLIGGGVEIGMQLYDNGSVTDWKAVGGSAVQGAIVGGAAGLTGGASLLVTASVMGGANAIGGAVNNKIQNKPITVLSVVTDASIGIAFGVAGKYISKFVKFKSGGSIVTSGITHGTELHWATMTGVAKTLASKGETVYLNKAINTALGKTIEGVGKWKPDVLSIGKNGVINLTEVISPSQTAKEILAKMATMKDALVKAGYKVNTTVLTEAGTAVTK